MIENDLVYSCGVDDVVKSWTIPNRQLKYEIKHGNSVYDIVIGREGTPLANKLLSISHDRLCRISNLETGDEVKTIKLDTYCCSIAVDKAQAIIAVGTSRKVTFFETTNFTKVKEFSLNDVHSLAFNKRNHCMLAVLYNGEVHSFKF